MLAVFSYHALPVVELQLTCVEALTSNSTETMQASLNNSACLPSESEQEWTH